MKKSQRGSHHGLLKDREDTKLKNTEELWRQVNKLRKEKPNTSWSYKEVWVGAGLKSNVALDSPWNAHVKEAIREHNNKVREQSDWGPTAQSERKTLRTADRDLRQHIEAVISNLITALSHTAVREAAAANHKRENQRLQKHLDRLSGLLAGVLSKI